MTKEQKKSRKRTSKSPEEFPPLSYSTLRWLQVCRREAWHLLRGVPSEVPRLPVADKGIHLHDKIRAALQAGEKYILVDDMIPPRKIHIGWLLGNDDPNLILMEQKMQYTIHGRNRDFPITVVPDLVRPGIVVDFKCGHQEVTENNIPYAYRLQAILYLYAFLSSPDWARYVIGNGMSYHIFNGRYGSYPLVCSYTYNDLPMLERQIINLCEEAERLFFSPVPPKPTPGECPFCSHILTCPVDKRSKIVSEEDAQNVAKEYLKLQEKVETYKRLLQKFVDANGNIDIGNGQVLGWQRTNKTVYDLEILKKWMAEDPNRALMIMSPDSRKIQKLAKEDDVLANAVHIELNGGSARWGKHSKTPDEKLIGESGQ